MFVLLWLSVMCELQAVTKASILIQNSNFISEENNRFSQTPQSFQRHLLLAQYPSGCYINLLLAWLPVESIARGISLLAQCVQTFNFHQKCLTSQVLISQALPATGRHRKFSLSRKYFMKNIYLTRMIAAGILPSNC